MNKAGLSAQQRRHLEVLAAADRPRSSYPGLLLGTLNSLSLKKLVTADRSRSGCFSSPNTSIKWSITESGRAEISPPKETQARTGMES